MPAEATDRREFRVMGSDASLIVVGGPAGLANWARQRLEDLEARWSRFRPDSEISRLNEAAGQPVTVSSETVQLIGAALEAWRLTGGAYDPTVLGDVLRAGYTTSFELLAAVSAAVRPSGSELRLGAGGIQVDAGAHQVQLPPGVGFDPGGIGKGLAADLVATELRRAGAAGACVNVGGDLRVTGTGPDAPSSGTGWGIAVEDPFGAEPAAVLSVKEGGVATSSRMHRRWTGPDGTPAHHLIDPATGRPADSDLAAVTVVAAHAWQAEFLAKAVFLAGATAGAVLLDRLGAAGLLIGTDGARHATIGLNDFLAPTPQPPLVQHPAVPDSAEVA